MAVSRPHITGIGSVPRAAPTKSIGPSLRRCWCKKFEIEPARQPRAGRITWDMFHQIKQRQPILRPKLYLPYRKLQALAVL
jgi:hypothetical protein